MGGNMVRNEGEKGVFGSTASRRLTSAISDTAKPNSSECVRPDFLDLSCAALVFLKLDSAVCQTW